MSYQGVTSCRKPLVAGLPRLQLDVASGPLGCRSKPAGLPTTFDSIGAESESSPLLASAGLKDAESMSLRDKPGGPLSCRDGRDADVGIL